MIRGHSLLTDKLLIGISFLIAAMIIVINMTSYILFASAADLQNKETIIFESNSKKAYVEPKPEEYGKTVIIDGNRFILFPVGVDGAPVSSNSQWNDCIRGDVVHAKAEPKICHRLFKVSKKTTQWHHPDMQLQFMWDIEKKYLKLPKGYLTTMEYNKIWKSYFSPSKNSSSIISKRSDIQSKIGIGIGLISTNGMVKILSVLPYSPAQNADIHIGDFIEKINGISVVNFPKEKIFELIRGEEKTSVQLLLKRGSFTLSKEIIRKKFDITSYEITYHEEIPIIHLYNFPRFTSSLKTDMEKELEKNPSGIILDLRNNLGGTIRSIQETASYFFPKNSTFAKIDRSGVVEELKTNSDPIVPESISIVTLIDEGTSNGAEALAAGLQEANRSIIIGGKTYGYGDIKNAIEFPNGKTIIEFVGHFLTSKGKKIHNIGIQPNIDMRNKDYKKWLEQAAIIINQ